MDQVRPTLDEIWGRPDVFLRLLSWTGPHPDDGAPVAHFGISPLQSGIESRLIEMAAKFGMASLVDAHGHPPLVEAKQAWVGFTEFKGRRLVALYRADAPAALGTLSTEAWSNAATTRGHALLTARADVFAGSPDITDFIHADRSRVFTGILTVTG